NKVESPTTISLQIPSLEIEDKEEQQVNNTMSHSMNIDISQNQNIHSNFNVEFDHHTNQYQLSSLHDDEDDMALGDEANGGIVENLSDDEEHIARSGNVSPTNNNDSDTPESNNRKPFEPTSIKQTIINTTIDDSIKFRRNLLFKTIIIKRKVLSF
ncbi:unnamed protein product, partial [Rotaria sp. Silwood1]